MILKHISQNGLPFLSKNDGSSKGFSQLFPKNQQEWSNLRRKITHRASEAFPTPLASKCLNGLCSISNTLFTSLTLWQSQPYMTSFAIWMTLVHSEPNIIFFKCTISSDVQFSGSTCMRPVNTWCEERVAAFGTEEVLFVISPFTKRGIIKSDKALVDDGSFAVVATRRKVLHNVALSVSYSTSKNHETDLVIIQMTIRHPFMLE